MIKITKKTHPKEWDILTKYVPGYRKRAAFLWLTDSVTLDGRYWDGGTKTNWILIKKEGIANPIGSRNDFPFTAPDTEIDLTDGTIAISTGAFCGKTATASIYLFREEQPVPVDPCEKELFSQTRKCSRCDCTTVNLKQDKCSNCGTPFIDVVLAKLVVAAEVLYIIDNHEGARNILKEVDSICENECVELPEDAIALNRDLCL